jgi:hypothetical protein
VPKIIRINYTPPNINTTSLENIDTFTNWTVESKRPIIKEAPSWLEEEEVQRKHVHGEREDPDDPPLLRGEELVQQKCNGTTKAYKAAASPVYTQIHTRAPISGREADAGGPFRSRQTLNFSHKRGRGNQQLAAKLICVDD